MGRTIGTLFKPKDIAISCNLWLGIECIHAIPDADLNYVGVIEEEIDCDLCW